VPLSSGRGRWGASCCVFRDEKDAIHTANAAEFGLTAGVFTRDVDRALRVSRQINAGTVRTNMWFAVNAGFEEGGFKQSGLGRLRGARGLADFQEIKTYVHFVPPAGDCHRFPNSKRSLQQLRQLRKRQDQGVSRSEAPLASSTTPHARERSMSRHQHDVIESKRRCAHLASSRCPACDSLRQAHSGRNFAALEEDGSVATET
jgi:delta 1-pyrroline-5-carboxylate dehydrogenase